jgi:hypothetical protein
VDVRLQLLVPSVQRRQDAHTSTQELAVAEQFAERLRSGREQGVRESGLVESPEIVELVRDREDNVMMGAGKQSLPPAIKPLFFGQPTTLRTTTVAARVVGDLMEVPIGATVDVPAQLTCSAMANGPSRVKHLTRQTMLLGELVEMLLEYRLKRDFHLPFRTSGIQFPRINLTEFRLPGTGVELIREHMSTQTLRVRSTRELTVIA